MPGRRTGFTPRPALPAHKWVPHPRHARESPGQVSANEVWRCGHALRVMTICSFVCASGLCPIVTVARFTDVRGRLRNHQGPKSTLADRSRDIEHPRTKPLRAKEGRG